MAVRGRLLVIGAISKYKEGDSASFNAWQDSVRTSHLLFKSVSVCGFFLKQFENEVINVIPQLVKAIERGQIRVMTDGEEKFKHGLHSIPDAIDYMHSGSNLGKVVVNIDDSSPAASKL